MTDTATIEALLERLEAKANLQPNKIEAAACLETESAEYLRTLLAENEQARRQTYEECAAIAATYREEAGGSECFNRACRHIQEAIRAKLDALPAQSKRNRDDVC